MAIMCFDNCTLAMSHTLISSQSCLDLILNILARLISCCLCLAMSHVSTIWVMFRVSTRLSLILMPYSTCRIGIQIHSESGFGFTGKSNGLDPWVLLEMTSLLFVYVCEFVILISLPVSLANPRQNRIRQIRESGLVFVKSNTAYMFWLVSMSRH